jgi:hypothetical protein
MIATAAILAFLVLSGWYLQSSHEPERLSVKRRAARAVALRSYHARRRRQSRDES